MDDNTLPTPRAECLAFCVACQTVRENGFILQACKHIYCYDCLVLAFRKAIDNVPFRAPSCCVAPLPFDDVKDSLNESERAKFLLNMSYYADPQKVFCANITCENYLGPDVTQKDTATCIYCSMSTCTRCKSLAHDGDCQDRCASCKKSPHPGLCDDGSADMLQLASRRRWQKCPVCHMMAERISGCDGVICRCGSLFCYRCGRKLPGYEGCPCKTRKPLIKGVWQALSGRIGRLLSPRTS